MECQLVTKAVGHDLGNVANLTARINSRHQYAAPWLAAMEGGLRKHGIQIVSGAADIEVVWSYNQDNIINPQIAAGRDVLVMELGYLGNRREVASCGFNGLNGRAWHPSGFGRGKQWQHLLKPTHAGDYALIIGQCFGDRSVRGVDFTRWAQTTAEQIDMPVYYRPHPVAPSKIHGLRTHTGTLEDALNRAHKVITFNSNVGVDAVLNGCTVIAHDEGSMVFNPPTDRMAWLNEIAYCQWSMQELRDGTAWFYLSQRYG
jgi:hypothetical protein